MKVRYNPEINFSHVLLLLSWVITIAWMGAKIDATLNAVIQQQTELREVVGGHEARIQRNAEKLAEHDGIISRLEK